MRLRAVLLVVGLLAPLAADAEPTVAGDTRRTLVVVLDAVPFATVDDLLASNGEGAPLFEHFGDPRPLISSFPSSTSVAMVGLLEPFDLPRSPGYEARFFDWDRRKARGGGAISFFRIDFAWREFFDWSRKGVVRSAWGGLRPIEVTVTRLERAIEAFLRAEESPYFVYLETTDLAAHLKGPEALAEVMEELDAALERARKTHPGADFRTVILSDHGVEGDGSRLVNVLPSVRQAVRGAGFRRTKRLRRTGDVVLTPFGLVSSFEAYSGGERIAELATTLAGAEGVDLCVYERDDLTMTVESRDGGARIERREGPGGAFWRYSVDSGDPLGYGGIAAELSGERSDGYASDRRWLQATARHAYPDALHRLTRAFDLVENPASVLCSVAPGYMYGRLSTEWLARVTGAPLRWTHGALSRDATLGFLLTDDERFRGSGAVRFDEALEPLTTRRATSGTAVSAAAAERRPHDKMAPDNER